MTDQLDILLGAPLRPRDIFDASIIDRVVHCKRDDYDVLVDRSTVWGNPFSLGDYDGDRAACGLAYCRWLGGEGVEMQTVGTRPDTRTLSRSRVTVRLHYLEGKTLGCWCAPKLCHGHVLAALAAAEDQRKELHRIIEAMEADRE